MIKKILIAISFLLIFGGCCVVNPWWGALIPVGIGCAILGSMMLIEEVC